MKANQFPAIPEVDFKPIVKKGYEGYAVSSDGRVWIGKRGKWRLMETYTFCDGEEAVWLKRGGGGAMFKVTALLAEAFTESPQTRPGNGRQ